MDCDLIARTMFKSIPGGINNMFDSSYFLSIPRLNKYLGSSSYINAITSRNLKCTDNARFSAD